MFQGEKITLKDSDGAIKSYLLLFSLVVHNSMLSF